jgi:protein SCO1/2
MLEKTLTATATGPPARNTHRGRSGIPFAALLIAGTVACWAKEERAGRPVRTGSDTGAPGKKPEFSSPKELRSLIDQDGKPFSFAGIGKKTVLVNFIFTSCPVVCPTQTQALIGIQRALPPALRPRVRIVSVTVDPDRDSASALRKYAAAMGVDFSGWSFVTGTGSELNWLYSYYAVAVNPASDGLYDHQAGVYMVDANGRVMQRYAGDIDKPRILREIGEVDALNK